MEINWVAVSAVADVIGVIGVVLSVMYLARQIRKQTDEARLTATRDLACQLNDVIGLYVTDPELLQQHRAASDDLMKLPPEVRHRVSTQMNRVIRIVEQNFLHMRHSNLDSAYVTSMDRRTLEIMSQPSYQQWWTLNRDAYGAEFRQYIEDRIAAGQSAGYVSSFRRPSGD